MDITNATNEQKASAAVAYLSMNMDKAPAETTKFLEKLNIVNNEGMALVRQMQDMKAKLEAMDGEIGQKIGGAKVLFEVIADHLNEDQINEFAKLFEPKKLAEKADVDIAGSTAPKFEVKK